MASQAEIDEPTPATPGRRIGCYAALVVLAVVAIGLAIAWLNRERIAGNVIASELAKRGIEATYKIERIGGRRQVLTDIVVGDPRRPDLTIERAEVVVRHRFGFPAIAAARPVRRPASPSNDVSVGSARPESCSAAFASETPCLRQSTRARRSGPSNPGLALSIDTLP